MARANMRALAGKVAAVEAPAAPAATAPVMEPVRTGERPVTSPTVEAAAPLEDARINFTIPRELRQRFKVWTAENETSIKDELTRHIRSLVG